MERKNGRTFSATATTIVANSPLLHVGFVGVLLTIVFFACLNYERRIVGSLGFAMDDAWIHMTVARNLVEGFGYGVAPGRTLPVSTSPSWTLLVALLYFFFRDAVQSVLTLSFISMFAVCLLCYFLVSRLTAKPLLGVLAALLLIGNPLMLWGLLSGMELPLTVVALFGVFSAYYLADPDSRTRRLWVPVLLAFAAITRPELFLLIPLALLDTFRTLYLSGTADSKRKAWRTALIQSLIILICLLPYFLFNLLSNQTLFPTTFYAKTIVRGVGLTAALKSGSLRAIRRSLWDDPIQQFSDIALMLFKQNFFVFFLLAVGALTFSKALGNKHTRRGLLLLAVLLVLPWVMGMTSPAHRFSNHADRYFVIFPPMAIVLACLGLSLVTAYIHRPVLAALYAILMLIPSWFTTPHAVRLLIYDVDSTERLYRPSAQWILENIPPQATLAVNDIGALSYFTRREMIDVMGLASPEIWPFISRPPRKKLDVQRLKDYLRERKVDYLQLCPKYYPALTSDTATFVPLMQWSERYKHGRLISPQVIYKCRWQEASPP